MTSTPADFLRQAMDAQGITDNSERAGIAGIVEGECHFKPHYEDSYAHTGDDRIRMIFGSRVSGLTDAQLDADKTDPAQWFELVYGYQTSVGRMLGNTAPGDGYKYRGCGDFQLTGKGNFILYGRLSGHPEIVDHPELANDPQIAAAVAVAYFRGRYHGGGFDQMLAAVGNNSPDIAATKRDAFARYLASGEFAAGVAPPAVPTPPVQPPAAPVAAPASRVSPAPSDDDGTEAEAERLNAAELRSLTGSPSA